AAFGTVSVVMIAAAAWAQWSGARSAMAGASAASRRSTGSGSRMTPVENGRTSSAATPSKAANRSQVRRASARPRAPVPALALPVFTTRARKRPPVAARCSRQTRTGAAQKRLRVNTPAAVLPAAKRITRVSVRPALRMPALATPSSTPAIGASADASGAIRFTDIEVSRQAGTGSGELAVAVLVFLARATGARVVATHFLAAADGLQSGGLVRLGALLQGQRDLVGVGAGRAGDVIEGGMGVADVAHGRRSDFLHLLGSLGRLDAHGHQAARRIVADPLLHEAEQLEGLELVLLLGILLGVAAQVDALSQVLERGEVFAPLLVHRLQHDRALEAGEGIGTDELDFRGVLRIGCRHDELDDVVGIDVLGCFDPFAQGQFELPFR